MNGGTITPSAFTVRTGGTIRCVSTSGKDSNPGTFSGGCWATIQSALQSMAAGDITYVENGVSEGDNCSQYNSATCILSAGSAGSPKAIVAYPGATVSINTNDNHCMRTPSVGGPGPHWVVAGINCNMTNNGEGFSFNVPDVRFVANSISCPNSFGTAACVDMESDGTTSPGMMVYGNTWNNVGISVNGQKTYHAMYFSASADHTDMAWNDLHQVHGCRAIQFYDASGRDMGDDHVHDNVIHDVVCDAINYSTMNSDEAGGVEAYNNVMYNVGKGPNPPDGAAVYSCVNTDSSQSHTAPAVIYNNTCLNSGFSGGGSGSGCFNPNLKTKLVNNICDQAAGQPYLASGSAGCSAIASGSANNDWFGSGSSPSCGSMTGSLNLDPQFANVSSLNLHLLATSPMVSAGSSTVFAKLDHDGLVRPNPPSIGGYELIAGAGAPPAPPTNLAITDRKSVV